MIEEKVEFLSDQSLFKGKVFMPDDLQNCKGMVVFVHGLGYCTKSYEVDGSYFSEHGYLLLTYNLRGHAGTPGEWTLNNSVEDLIIGINYLARNYKFPKDQNIGVLGHSTGALIAMLAAIKEKRIKFGSIVTIVTSLSDSYAHWFRSGFNQEVKAFFKAKGEIHPFIEGALNRYETFVDFRNGKLDKVPLEFSHRYGLLRSSNFRRFWNEIANSPNILDVADQIEIPLILFRGQQDEVMPLEKTDELYMRLKVHPKKLIKTNSTNHFHNDSWRFIQEETIKYFDEILLNEQMKADSGS